MTEAETKRALCLTLLADARQRVAAEREILENLAYIAAQLGVCYAYREQVRDNPHRPLTRRRIRARLRELRELWQIQFTALQNLEV